MSRRKTSSEVVTDGLILRAQRSIFVMFGGSASVAQIRSTMVAAFQGCFANVKAVV